MSTHAKTPRRRRIPTRKRRRVAPTHPDQLANAAIGAAVGGLVAGPVGVVAGAAVGAGVEKGPAAKGPAKTKPSPSRRGKKAVRKRSA